MTTITIEIPSVHFGVEHMTFSFGTVSPGTADDDSENNVRVLHSAGKHGVLSDGPLRRSNARRWYAGALRDGGKIIDRY